MPTTRRTRPSSRSTRPIHPDVGIIIRSLLNPNRPRRENHIFNNIRATSPQTRRQSRSPSRTLSPVRRLPVSRSPVRGRQSRPSRRQRDNIIRIIRQQPTRRPRQTRRTRRNPSISPIRRSTSASRRTRSPRRNNFIN